MDDPEKFQRDVQDVCACYLQAPKRFAEDHVHTVSVDEMTGIQALERIICLDMISPWFAEVREKIQEQLGIVLVRVIGNRPV